MLIEQCRRTLALFAFASLASVGSITWAAYAAPKFSASQKGQAFQPGQLAIKRGDTVEIVNDDGEILHHAYVESKTFSFDSGDQAPGEKVDITFTTAGTFNVLCGIHPRMKLRVQVD